MNKENNLKASIQEQYANIMHVLGIELEKFELDSLDEVTVTMNFYFNTLKKCVELLNENKAPRELMHGFISNIRKHTMLGLDKLEERLKEEGLLND